MIILTLSMIKRSQLVAISLMLTVSVTDVMLAFSVIKRCQLVAISLA